MGSFVNILEENGKIYILFFYNNEKIVVIYLGSSKFVLFNIN
jgi:hypothetical protein